MPRHTIIPAVYLILLNTKNQICITRRFNTGYADGYYSLPAGHLDGRESLKTAMIREAKEEIGIQINELDLELVHVNNSFGDNPERIEFFFTCRKWTGEVKINEPEKCDDLQWVDLDAVPANTTQIVIKALKGFQNHELYSDQSK